MNPVFISILNEGETIVRDSLEELITIPNLVMFFKREVHHERVNTFGQNEQYYKFTHIDTKGERQVIEIGNFQITEICPEEKRSSELTGKRVYFTAIDILVFDKIKKRTSRYRQILPVKSFFIEELMPLIETLKKIQDWDIFMSMKTIPLLEQEISTLKEKLKIQTGK